MSVEQPALSREQAIEVVRLLNDLWWDILAGDGLFQLLEEHRIAFKSEAHLDSVRRMVFFHLALVLCKLQEFHKLYSRFLSPDCRLWLKELSAEVERRRLIDLRHKAIGHIHDKDTGMPLTGVRLDDLFQKVVDGDSGQFCRWMRNQETPGDLSTVMGRVKWIIDSIMRAHSLEASDVGLTLNHLA